MDATVPFSDSGDAAAHHPGYRTDYLGSETYFFIGASKRLCWTFRRLLILSLLEGYQVPVAPSRDPGHPPKSRMSAALRLMSQGTLPDADMRSVLSQSPAGTSFFARLRDRLILQETRQCASSFSSSSSSKSSETPSIGGSSRVKAIVRGLKAALRLVNTISSFAPTFRRIDIKSYPVMSWPSALLYFTGSAHFNRSMRLYAIKQLGLSLSDKGLVYTGRTSAAMAKSSESCIVYARDEKDIFDALGLRYIPPNLRNPERTVDYQQLGGVQEERDQGLLAQAAETGGDEQPKLKRNRTLRS